MNIHPDAIIFVYSIAITSIGFILGRMERKGAYTRMYRHGFNIGKQVGKIER